MCIRDRHSAVDAAVNVHVAPQLGPVARVDARAQRVAVRRSCLLYTSDAADERSSVALGGRRIIKKKNNTDTDDTSHITEHDNSDD